MSSSLENEAGNSIDSLPKAVGYMTWVSSNTEFRYSWLPTASFFPKALSQHLHSCISANVDRVMLLTRPNMKENFPKSLTVYSEKISSVTVWGKNAKQWVRNIGHP